MREFEPPIYYSPDSGAGSGTAGKEPDPIQDETIRIGNSNILLSKELQLECFLMGGSSYESTKSILTIEEPHHNAEAQFSLFRGLEIFFRDNPELVRKTIFLAEGFPANQPVFVQELIDADPHPSDELIRETLGSFLITGYMAYEWKHQQHIPIIGTEDPELYALSREFATWYVDDPNALLARVFIMDTKTTGHEYRLPVSAGWTFAINARNKTIASTFINQARRYENPILFVGGGHLNERQDEKTFDLIQQVAIGEVASGAGMFGHYLKTVDPKTLENHSIHYYLQETKIGYNALMPFGFVSKKEEMAYQRLFEAQRAGGRADQAGVDNEGYLDWLLKTKRLKPGQHTTVQPDPKTAAEFVRRLKEKQKHEEESENSGLVYEAPPAHDTKYDWFGTSPEEERSKIREKFGVDSIWQLGQAVRGRAYEYMRGAEPANNLEHVDDIRLEARTVTGMKTIELRDPTYQDIENLDRRLRDCIDELEGYPGGTWKGHSFRRGEHFDDVYLEIGIPADKATRAQTEKLLEMQDYAQTKGVTLVINEVP